MPVAAPSPDAAEESVMEFVKDRVLMDDVHGRFVIDEAKSPKRITIDFRPTKAEKKLAIYKLDGDTLTFARHTKSNKLLPADFDPDPEAGVIVVVYTRLKGDRPPKDKPAPGVKPGSTDLPAIKGPVAPPARNLQREVDQLREQLQRLEKELKERRPDGPGQ
jgi:uncharacterized protein (TIGR03067 family)